MLLDKIFAYDVIQNKMSLDIILHEKKYFIRFHTMKNFFAATSQILQDNNSTYQILHDKNFVLSDLT